MSFRQLYALCTLNTKVRLKFIVVWTEQLIIAVRLDAPELCSYAYVTVEDIMRLYYSTVSGTNLFQRDLTSRPGFVSRLHYAKLTLKKERKKEFFTR